MATAKKQNTGYGAWKKLVGEQLERLESTGDVMERLGRQATEQATAAIDQMNRLYRDQLEYTFRLAGQWRRLGSDFAHRAADMVGSTLQAL